MLRILSILAAICVASLVGCRTCHKIDPVWMLCEPCVTGQVLYTDPLLTEGGVTMEDSSAVEFRTLTRDYWEYNVETGQWEKRSRQETVVAPRTQATAGDQADSVRWDDAIPLSRGTLDSIRGVNAEKLREFLVATIRTEMKLALLNEGSVRGNSVLLTVWPDEQNGVHLLHEITATITNRREDTMSFNVVTKAYQRREGFYLPIIQITDPDLAKKFAIKLKKAVQDAS